MRKFQTAVAGLMGMMATMALGADSEYENVIHPGNDDGTGFWNVRAKWFMYAPAFSFERVCLQHVQEIKKALGISGMLCGTYSWRSRSEDPDMRGAQIDLVIDRADKAVNLCEIKYASGKYEIDKGYSRELIEKCEAFRRETGLGGRA